jgi:hypothetical protein
MRTKQVSKPIAELWVKIVFSWILTYTGVKVFLACLRQKAWNAYFFLCMYICIVRMQLFAFGIFNQKHKHMRRPTFFWIVGSRAYFRTISSLSVSTYFSCMIKTVLPYVLKLTAVWDPYRFYMVCLYWFVPHFMQLFDICKRITL